MPSIVKFCKLLQFADDTTLICSSSDFDSVKMQLSYDFALVSDWISASCLKLNINKSSVLWFTPKSPQNVSCPSIIVNDNQLKKLTTKDI